MHVEGPDECGHRAETENKVRSIELIDEKILAPVLSYLEESGEPFKVMILPDHPTPIAIRTHSIDPVPFLIYASDATLTGTKTFTEQTAREMNNYLPDGYRLMELLTEGTAL